MNGSFDESEDQRPPTLDRPIYISIMQAATKDDIHDEDTLPAGLLSGGPREWQSGFTMMMSSKSRSITRNVHNFGPDHKSCVLLPLQTYVISKKWEQR